MTDVPKAMSQPSSSGWAPPPWPRLSQWALATGILESPGEGLLAAGLQRSGGSAGVWGILVPCLCGWGGAAPPCSVPANHFLVYPEPLWREHATSCSMGSTCSFKATLLCSGSCSDVQ